MEFVMNELGVLGDHFGLVIIGCAELAIAAVYAGIMLVRRTKKIRKKVALREVGQKIPEEIFGKTDEGCIWLLYKDPRPRDGLLSRMTASG